MGTVAFLAAILRWWRGASTKVVKVDMHVPYDGHVSERNIFGNANDQFNTIENSSWLCSKMLRGSAESEAHTLLTDQYRWRNFLLYTIEVQIESPWLSENLS
jgi:hypothetical protein